MSYLCEILIWIFEQLVISLLTDLAEGFIFQFGQDGTTYKIVLALLFIAIYLVGFNVGNGSLTFILAHEVFTGEDERVVVTGTSLATMCLWFFSIILSLFFKMDFGSIYSWFHYLFLFNV